VITREDTTYADWVGAFVDVSAMTGSRSTFTRFWFDEVDRLAMKRNWLRWACGMAQHSFKITKGNAYDSQHAAYLPDCDVFLTADQRYAAALKDVRAATPFNICEIYLVPETRGKRGQVLLAIEAALDTYRLNQA